MNISRKLWGFRTKTPSIDLIRTLLFILLLVSIINSTTSLIIEMTGLYLSIQTIIYASFITESQPRAERHEILLFTSNEMNVQLKLHTLYKEFSGYV